MSYATAYRLPIVVLSFIALLAIAAYAQSQPKAPATPIKEAVKEDLTADKPSEAEAFSLRKRVPPGEKSLPMDRYWKARQDANGLRRYSTRLGSFISEQSGLSPAELNALGNWT